MKQAILIFILLLSSSLLAEEKTPTLSELEQAHLTNIYLMSELRLAYQRLEACTADLGTSKSDKWNQTTQSQLKILKEELEKEHKGYIWNPETGFVKGENKEKK